MRRARGYAPRPVPLPVPALVGQALLAAGAQLKHTYTLAAGDRALLGPHTGDLSDSDTFDAFTASLTHLTRLYGIEPTVVAHDLHPRYLSARYAQRWPADRRVLVQHHHAHVVSCAAEHGITSRFIGVAYDGLGLGDDGTLWGGEVLVADLAGYRRVGRFARAIASRPDVTFTSYGAMLRVPGSSIDLLALKARGADVRPVYSPMEAVRLAAELPHRQLVFFGVGFETTAPANAAAVLRADRVLDAMRDRPEGTGATRVGVVVADHPGRVDIRTLLGARRIVDTLIGEQLPQIC